MFGPTARTSIQELIDYNHREPRFFDLFYETVNLMKEKFNLHEYDILFITGSGTLTMEALIFSCRYRIHTVGPSGTFLKRWKSIAEYYKTNKEDEKEIRMSCSYETSISKAFSLENSIIDAVCAFPYYDLPKRTIAFGTVSNKMLCSAPVIGIVGIKKDKWNLFIDSSVPSYLNLRRYLEYSKKKQTPFTPAYSLIANLKKNIKEFDIEALQTKINKVSHLLVDYFKEENIIGDLIGPAITINRSMIPDEIAKKWNLYGYWHHKNFIQIFTYSEDLKEYKKFIKDLRSFS